MGAALLHTAYGDAMDRLPLAFLEHLQGTNWRILRRLIGTGQVPLTSSAGRLFDGVAALVGVRHEVQFEAQAAMELETLAADLPGDETYPVGVRRQDGVMILETMSMVRAIVRDLLREAPIAWIAAKFHNTLAEVIQLVCRRLRHRSGVTAVALSGGVFQNVRLLSETVTRLEQDGFTVYTHHVGPPNDGGVSLGQAAVGGAMLAGRSAGESAPCA